MSEPQPASLRQELQSECAEIGWHELERHYARGVVLRVEGTVGLLEVAEAMAVDDRATVAGWLDSGELAAVSSEEAARWHAGAARLNAVVVAPWVLVTADNP